MVHPYLTDAAYEELCKKQDADKRVWELMELICSEFESDPMSVQCFDLRIVKESIALVKARKSMKDPFNLFEGATK